MLLQKLARLYGILLNNGNIVLLIGFLGVIHEIVPAATCPTSYGCDIYCQNDTYGCYDCPSYYGLIKPASPPPYQRCLVCGVECLQCTHGVNCTQCRTGYGPIDSWNCGVCQTENCYTCPENMSTCMNCKPGYGFYPNRTTCGVCSANCIDYGCDAQFPGKCDKCDSGFGYTSTNSCEACSTHCAAGCYMTGAGKCDSCDSGYGLMTNGSCGACSAHCGAGCLAIGAGKCIQCDPGYGFTVNGSCDNCSLHCAAGCNVSGECIQCDSGFGLTTNRSCAACSPNCNLTMGCNISGAGFCDQCNNGYGWVNASTDKSCVACSLNCSAGCNSTGAGKCDQCDPGTVRLLNGSCAACSLNCNSTIGCNISGAGYCDQCNNGFGWVNASTDKSCVACSVNCAAGCNVTGAGKCDICNIGYESSADGSCALTTTVQPTTTVITTTTVTPTSTVTPTIAPGTTVQPPTFTGNMLNSNTSTVSVPHASADIGTNTGSTVSIGTGSSESTISATRGSTQPPVLRDNDVVMLTLIMLVGGGIIVCLIATVGWCIRFYVKAKPWRIWGNKKKL